MEVSQLKKILKKFFFIILGRIKQKSKQMLLKGGLQPPQPLPWIRLCTLNVCSATQRTEAGFNLAGMQRDKPRSEGGDPLRHRCLDGCYGNRRHSEARCVVILAEASGKGKGVKRGKQEDEGLIEWLKLRLRSHTLTCVNQRWIPKYFRSAVGVLEGIPGRDWRNSFPGSGGGRGENFSIRSKC